MTMTAPISQASKIIRQSAQIDDDFAEWMHDNTPVYLAFEQQAKEMHGMGYQHYSARTIAEWIRHHTALSEDCTEYKLNNNVVPKMARLFAIRHPDKAHLFSYREVQK